MAARGIAAPMVSVRRHAVSADVCHIDVLRFLGKIFSMRITGNLFHAARALAGLTREDLATRGRLSRDVLYVWETSSNALVPAQYQLLCRALDVLEAEGVRFSDGGVHLQRTAPMSTTLPSERIVA
jgi:hypothetical protein